MNRLGSLASVGIAALLTIAGGGCSGSGGTSSPSMITGSIFSSSPKTAAAADGAQAVKPEDPLARPVNVAWTSARAAKCGFYFDPGKLRQSFLTSQKTAGVQADQLAKVQTIYDTSYSKVSAALAGRDDYCDAEQIADIKTDLNRHLAGDFSTTEKKVKASQTSSTWEWLSSGNSSQQQMNRNDIFFPSGGGHATGTR